MARQINILGFIALGSFVLGMIPSIGMWFSIIGMILTMILYSLVDKLGYGTNLFKINLYQWIAVIIPLLVLSLLGVNFAEAGNNRGVNLVLLGLCLVLLLFLAGVNYLVAKNLTLIGQKSSNLWFRVSGGLTKAGAYTMPVLIGLVFVMLAQPIFLLGCIAYKPQAATKDSVDNLIN